MKPNDFELVLNNCKTQDIHKINPNKPKKVLNNCHKVLCFVSTPELL